MSSPIIAPSLVHTMVRNGLDAVGRERAVRDASWEQFQAELMTAAQAIHAPGVPHDGTLWAPEVPIVAQLQSFLAKTARANETSQPVLSTTREVMMDDRDWVGWARSFFDWWRKLRPVEFAEPHGVTYDSIANDASLAMFGDWGSGRYGAPVIARTIAEMKDPLAAVIHLGDTYYAGTPDEIRENVLSIWPRRPDAQSFLLNGNHERYGGDIGYYDALDTLEQSFSYFALRNDHFVVVGLDSAYEDCALAGRQVAWLNELLAISGEHKVILLTHHQPFSAFEGGAFAMVKALTPLLASRRIHAWYWGHEHRCVRYEPHPAWGVLGRCIGHGGYPYDAVVSQGDWVKRAGLNNSQWYGFGARGDIPAGTILADRNPYVVPKPGSTHTDYGAHGFVVLRLDGPRCIESYLRPDGEVIWQEQLAI